MDAAKPHVEQATASLNRLRMANSDGVEFSSVGVDNSSPPDTAVFERSPQALDGVMLFHGGEDSETVGRLLATMDVARL